MQHADALNSDVFRPIQGRFADVAQQIALWRKCNFEGDPAAIVPVATGHELDGSAASARPHRIELVGSSNGCASFRVHLENRTLKCYECLTPRRARLVYELSNVLRGQGVEMPPCLGVQENVVVAEWVDGRPLAEVAEPEKIELMAVYQARMHGAALPARFNRHDAMPHTRWLFERVRQFGRGIVDDALVVQLRDRLIGSRPEGAPWGVLHSDFITTNLVVTEPGVVSVDNEFLCVGYGQEWDILNTVKVSFPDRPRLQQWYLDTYAKYRSLHTLVTHRSYWEAVYEIKIAGKRLSEDRAEEGLRHLHSAATIV